MRPISKVVAVYAVSQLGFLLCLVIACALLVYGSGSVEAAFKALSPLLVKIMVTVTYVAIFISPMTLAGARFYRFSNVVPNGEARLTAAMLMALVASCYPLAIAAPFAAAWIGRLVPGNLFAWELPSALATIAANYALNVIFALTGIRIGLRLTKRRFAQAPQTNRTMVT
jgi:hypothetical protein